MFRYNFFNPNLYKPDETVKWLSEVENWRACDVDLNINTECQKFYNSVTDIIKCDFLKPTTCRALYQKAGQNLIKHTHRRIPNQNHLCVNYICTKENAPINFTNYGNINYKFSMLNTTEQHSVPASSHDRYLIGVQYSYINENANWNNIKSLLKNVQTDN